MHWRSTEKFTETGSHMLSDGGQHSLDMPENQMLDWLDVPEPESRSIKERTKTPRFLEQSYCADPGRKASLEMLERR